jgi:hypothetical protein
MVINLTAIDEMVVDQTVLDEIVLIKQYKKEW